MRLCVSLINYIPLGGIWVERFECMHSFTLQCLENFRYYIHNIFFCPLFSHCPFGNSHCAKADEFHSSAGVWDRILLPWFIFLFTIHSSTWLFAICPCLNRSHPRLRDHWGGGQSVRSRGATWLATRKLFFFFFFLSCTWELSDRDSCTRPVQSQDRQNPKRKRHPILKTAVVILVTCIMHI